MVRTTHPTLSQREWRAVLMGAALIAAMVAGNRGIPAWSSWRADNLAAAAELVAEADRALASIRSMDETLDSLERRHDRLVALYPMLVASGTPASAAGALAAHVSRAAAAAPVSLGSVQLHVDTADAGVFTRVSVRATAIGDIRGIVGLISVLERGPPLVNIREWSMSSPDPASPPDHPEALHAELVVQGLALIRQPEADP
jgi:hypothetical protein